MAKMLELPRELYLMICSYLSPTDLARLCSVSRDHYLAAQEPLFSEIRLETYRSLVKLVTTLMKVPVVSHISPKQRLHWHKLSDAQLRERDIKHLDLLIDSKQEGGRVTGAVLSRCIGAISRKCATAKMSLTFNRVWTGFAKQMNNLTFPNVGDLIFYAGPDDDPTDPPGVYTANTEHLGMEIWELALSGSTFPDLRAIYMNDLVGCAGSLPANMRHGWQLVDDSHMDRDHSGPLASDCSPFFGLNSMEVIKLKYNSLLNPPVLHALFGSSVIPRRLTRLEIVQCPNLAPITNLEDLATLLCRGLPLLQFLKLHVTRSYAMTLEARYVSKINEHPEHHLCSIVRELGQNIKGLDLVLPFACNQIFKPITKRTRQTEAVELPKITREPVNTLSDRLIASDCRYRRVVYHGICRRAHGWDEMALLAASQGGKVSWDIWSENDQKAVWFVSGCLPVEFSLRDALSSPEYAE